MLPHQLVGLVTFAGLSVEPQVLHELGKHPPTQLHLHAWP